MPDLHAQLERHEAYVELPVQAYSVWWRDDDGIKTSGRLPGSEVDQVVSHLNESYYPVTFWRSPVYRWTALIDAASSAV